jgi:hypothetical protein
VRVTEGARLAAPAARDELELCLLPQSRLVEVLSKVERLSRGAESERIEQGGQPVRIVLGFNPTPNIAGPEQGLGYVEQDLGYIAPRELPPGSPN